MALTKCKECGAPVTEAAKCPHCGHRFGKSGERMATRFILAVLGLGAILSFGYTGCTRDAHTLACSNRRVGQSVMGCPRCAS